MIIRLIPRVCDESGVTDPERCKVILEYCKEGDHADVCTVKMIGHAVMNPENLNDAAHVVKGAFNAGAASIDYMHESAQNYMIDIVQRTAEWHSHVSGVPAKIVVEGVRIGFEILGMGVDAFIGG